MFVEEEKEEEEEEGSSTGQPPPMFGLLTILFLFLCHSALKTLWKGLAKDFNWFVSLLQQRCHEKLLTKAESLAFNREPWLIQRRRNDNAGIKEGLCGQPARHLVEPRCIERWSIWNNKQATIRNQKIQTAFK